MPDDDDNVIQFRGARSEPSARTKNWGLRCKHLNVEVDEATRTLTCRDCREETNAFDWVSDWARNQTIDFSRADAVERHLDELRKKMTEATKELKSLEAKIKRRKAKLQ